MSDRFKVFIAGPMTGLPGYNLEAFAEAAELLNDAGFEAVNPGDRGVIPGYEWSDYLRDSLARLVRCDFVVVLPGWRDSRGARLEVAVARSLGIKVDELDHYLSGAWRS